MHIFSKMPLSRVYFSIWLMSLWSPNMFYEVNVTYCFQDCFWLSDYETDTDYKVVLFLLTRCLVMFILCCNCINVEMIRSLLLNGGAPAIWRSTLNSAKTTFIVWISQYNEQHLKSETLFHIKSTKAQCLLRFTGWKLCFNDLKTDWSFYWLKTGSSNRFLGFKNRYRL